MSLYRSLLFLCLLPFLAACHAHSSSSDETPAVSTAPPAPVLVRSLLYSVQTGEGFSLRRDAFVRIGVALMLSNSSESWQLVLPPLYSALSPHWHQGLQHAGVGFHRTVPWETLYDLDFLSAQTGVKFVEFDAWARSQPTPASPSIDQVLHLCSFHYTEAFFAEARRAAAEGRVAPNSSHPRSQLFLPFGCGETPPEQGFCGGPRPIVTNVGTDLLASAEYGSLRLSRPASQSVECGLSNLQPIVLPTVIADYLSPSVSSILVTNVQLIFWPPLPYPGAPPDPLDPHAITHGAKTKYLRALRLAPRMLAIAHTFVAHELRASAALELDSPRAVELLSSQTAAALSSSVSPLPPYIAFHVRRGDFLRVHASVVPDMNHLAMQLRQRFLNVSKERDAQGLEPISNRVFISSDMTAREFLQLQQALASLAAATDDVAAPRPELVRFDLERVRVSLREHLSAEVNSFLDASASAASAAADPSASVTPLTPFHILLLDQYLCECALEKRGFVGTQYSYVSELIWQNRRAKGLEDLKAWDKEVLVGGAAPAPAPVTAAPASGSSSSPSAPAPAAAKLKDEL